MCNIREALAVCCLFLNTANSMIFSLIPKIVPNFDTKSISDSTVGTGQIFKDETGTLPLIGNSIGSATNSDPHDDKFFAGNFGIEIPNLLKSNSQNEVEIPSPFNLGLIPSNSIQIQNLEEATPQLRSNLNNFEYQTGNVPNFKPLPNGPLLPHQSFNNFEHYSENIPTHQSLPNKPPQSRQLPSDDIKNNSDRIPASLLISNEPTCNSGKEPTENEAKSPKNEFNPTFPVTRFLNLETFSKGPVATLKLSGDIYLNSLSGKSTS